MKLVLPRILCRKCNYKSARSISSFNAISEPPFATFLKCEHQYLLSASPERYIKKEGTKCSIATYKRNSEKTD